MDSKHCRGCRDDFYNHGGNGLGGKGCWMLPEARLVWRYRTHRDTPPLTPGAFTRVEVPSCYHGAPWYYSNTYHPDAIDRHGNRLDGRAARSKVSP